MGNNQDFVYLKLIQAISHWQYKLLCCCELLSSLQTEVIFKHFNYMEKWFLLQKQFNSFEIDP